MTAFHVLALQLVFFYVLHYYQVSHLLNIVVLFPDRFLQTIVHIAQAFSQCEYFCNLDFGVHIITIGSRCLRLFLLLRFHSLQLELRDEILLPVRIDPHYQFVALLLLFHVGNEAKTILTITHTLAQFSNLFV